MNKFTISQRERSQTNEVRMKHLCTACSLELAKLESGFVQLCNCAAKESSSGTRDRRWQMGRDALEITASAAEVYPALVCIKVLQIIMVHIFHFMVWCGGWCGLVHVVQCSMLVNSAEQSWWQVREGMLMQPCILTFRYVPAFPNLPTSFCMMRDVHI